MAKGHAGGLSRKECESRGTLLELLERYPDEESCERRLLEDEYLHGQAPVIIAARHRLRRESAPGTAPCSTVPS